MRIKKSNLLRNLTAKEWVMAAFAVAFIVTGVWLDLKINCTPCQGHFYLFVLGNVCLSTLQLTIPSNG